MAAIVVGGANGMGLAIAMELAKTRFVTIVDKVRPEIQLDNMSFVELDLTDSSYEVLDGICDVDTLVITAGFGRLALFEDISEEEMIRQIQVNTLAPMRLIKRFYDRISGKESFYTAVMVSIAAFMSSPFFSTYAASKAALRIFIETLNTELSRTDTRNRLLNVSPGSFQGSKFGGGTKNQLNLLTPLAQKIIAAMYARKEIYIPQYNTIYKQVLERYQNDPVAEALHSYDYKLERIRKSGQM